MTGSLVRFCVVAFLALFAGAANSQQKGNPATACYQALIGDARFAPIREKVALGGTMDEMRRMTKSDERASAQEKPVLAAWRDARESCHRLEKPYFATRDNAIEALALQHFTEVQALIGELQSGALSYGEFGRRRIDLFEKRNRQIEEVRQGILPPKVAPHTIKQQ